MRAIGPLMLLCATLAGMALAEPPKTSPRPVLRPALAEATVEPTVETEAMPAVVLRPRHRPDGFLAPSPAALELTPEIAAAPDTTQSAAMLRPHPRPKNLAAPDDELAADQPESTEKPNKKQSRKGSVCGDPDIRGQEIPSITSKTKGCGVAEPVRVTAINGIPFSQPATFDCDTARALKRWMREGMTPAFGNREVVQLHIFGSYMCRSRNNVRGAKISEHGRGKAVDIAGFVFSDGREWTVARDYNKQIRRAQKAACGIFGTTLGPGSDGYHEDHLHFDTADYRSGAYCR